MHTRPSVSLSTWWRQRLHHTAAGHPPAGAEKAAPPAMIPLSLPESVARRLQDLDVAGRADVLCAAAVVLVSRYGGALGSVVIEATATPVPLTPTDGSTCRDLLAATRAARRENLAPASAASSTVEAVDGGPWPLAVLALDDPSEARPPCADIMIEATPAGCRVRCRADRCAEAERIAAHLGELACGILDRPDCLAADLPMLTARERAQVVDEFNRTDGALDDRPTPGLVAPPSQREAVVCGDQRLTYADLHAAARGLARRLRVMGCQRGDRVAVFLERSAEMPVALLGVLQAGAAYVPLDPTMPARRLSMMLADAGVRAVITRRSLVPRLPGCGGVVVCLDEEAQGDDASPGDVALEGGDLAYVIFTSGSTGRPKGVELQHHGLTNLLTAMQATLRLAPSDRMLAVTTLCFDIATMDMFLPLCAGGTLVIAQQDDVGDGLRLAALLQRSGATIMQATPATWRMLVATGWRGHPRLTAISGGEPLAPDLAADLLERCGRLWNMYGPTETTIYSTVCRVTRPDDISIGRPIANTRAYVLDGRGEPVPVGVTGELHLGGAGVARGYLARPELTAERFLDSAFGRLYRTGDVARWRVDGQLECLGRVDHQVKIRGYRIEPGEIEVALRAHSDVEEAVVAAQAEQGENRLVAWVGCPRREPSRKTLRAHLLETLPDYMVPSIFVTVERLPRLPNGKLDRASLPAPRHERRGMAELVLPRSATESALAQAFEEVLETSPVGVTDDFFDLGGTSVQASVLFARLQERFRRRLHPTELLTAPTVEALAHRFGVPDDVDPRRCLVALNPDGDRAPLFCMHAGAGTVLFYQQLSRRLGGDRPVYALQAPGLYGGPRSPADSVEAAAAQFIDEMRCVQPHGPYHLAGFCFGALTAFEVARQLRERGERVGLLAALDGPSPRLISRTEAESPGSWVAGAGDKLRRLSWRERLDLVLQALRWRLAGPPAKYRIGRICARLGLGVPQRLRDRFFHVHHLRLERRYRPQPYDGHMVVVSTRGLFETPSLEWEGLCATLETHAIDIDIDIEHKHHRDLMQAPAVDAVADILRNRLQADDVPDTVAS